ncbi:major facilitator superfamily domain-containing protein [Echria macrotheca]|uniref:Efflux pump dotC n=1 Tax=Echria macrotheca TaxID=438768 RepID=A0AAJ0BH10_9PEZI|nr:major facilitator superfamily domain-containing protein [Echria macrotheca]
MAGGRLERDKESGGHHLVSSDDDASSTREENVDNETTRRGPSSQIASSPTPPEKPEPKRDATAAAAAAPEEGRTRAETALIITALSSALFLAALDMTIVTVAIPTIAAELHSTAGYTWIGSAYMLASASMAPMWGKISDIWGRKPIMLIAVGIFWVGSLLCGLSKNMGMLIAVRALQGVGGGGIIILVNICISDLFSMRKRGVYFGAMGIVWAAAGGIGPVLGGVFTSKVSWRWCFYVNLPISGVGMLILARVLKLYNPRTAMREGLAAVDWLGSLSVLGATLMVMLGLEFGGVTKPWDSATVVCLIVFGCLMAVLFGLVEWKVAKFPIIPMRLFGVRSNVASLLVSAFQGFVFISGSYYLPLYFQSVLGATPLMSGVYILPYVLSLSLVSAASGGIIKKTGRYLPMIIGGMALMTLGYGLFVDLDRKPNWAKVVVYQLIAGAGVGPNFQGPLIALQTMVEPRDMASATATYGFIRQLSTAVSIVIGGVVFQNGMQAQYPALVSELGPEIANLLSGANAASSVSLVNKLPDHQREIARDAYFDSLRTMYIMYAVFAGVGLICSFFIGHRVLSKQHQEHKTGLAAMREARDQSAQVVGRQPDKMRAADEEEGTGLGSDPDVEKKESKKKSWFIKRPAFFFE